MGPANNQWNPFDTTYLLAVCMLTAPIQLFQLTLSDQSLKLKGIFKAAASSST